MSNSVSIDDQIKKLTKAELLALLQERGVRFYIKPIDIAMAKCNVLIEKADQIFGQWEDFKCPGDMGNDLAEHINYLKARKDREVLWNKWMRLNDQIDRLHNKMKNMEY